MFRVQDWVQNRATGKVGYVDHVSSTHINIYNVDGSISCLIREIVVPMTSTLDNNQIYMLMSHAVDIGNREWFEELRQRLTEEVV
ncbi:hypothetical protein [Terribacillus saccharophilus]|uniref:hypothetical protein n=1 Tax=Terribacillus saccharophilus TaxID=361277 RepID=UPI000BA7CFF5|nr:hypothetical protein [Terribacillus saccharophilus]PAF19736.1 hypothetical protein CHH51_01350 [Terribacillus saccharophilus]